MSDEEALLAAISAHPDEDTPRLAFADWLDENDRGIRAEFIRIQCALTQLGNRSPEEKWKLSARQRYLLENHRRDILGPLGADLTIFNVTFDRGFAAELNITDLLFLQRATAIGELRPAPRIHVHTASAAKFVKLLHCPEMGLVVEFIATCEVGARGAHQLATCSHLTRLEVLTFVPPNTAIGNSGLRALAYSDTLLALIDLNIHRNEISDEGVGRLVASPLWRRLRRLDLSYNALTDASADYFANAPASAIERLDLRGVNFSAALRRRLVQTFGDRIELL
ncbi:TIGR02996 domain-containing protein [Gemmata sp. G18]|uniref:TIGR02996 domain-containing protein n=1 Tax=Gemmata palustris TaxID=2822762 RepID=A0ABS5C225_9BACT|nr:TIGR02996 domain-containing protein [Gemmata palustris]MBP3960037.1 TIGR02996 domain-containing protein [Gemmata palustris]